MTFCKLEIIIIESNYFQNGPKDEAFYFFDDFEALVLENHPKSIRSRGTSISRTSASKGSATA
jgi:hypothetical protein